MGLFDIFRKAQPERKPTEAPRNPVAIKSGNRRPLVSYDSTILANQAMAHPVVFRCLHKIASSVETVDWYAEIDPDAKGAKVSASDVDRFNDLLKSPNDTYTQGQLKYWMALNFALFGRVPFLVGTGTEQKPNGIYPLAVKFLTTETDERGVISKFIYGSGERAATYPSKSRANGKPYAYQIFTPNVDGDLDLSCNVTPLRSIGLPADVITLLLRRAKDTASGHPNTKYVITSERTLTEPQRDSIQQHIEDSAAGGSESGNVLFLTSQDIKVHELNNDLSDIHSKMPSDDMSRMIFGAFGIPVALMGLGAADGAKFAGNYAESRASFYEDTLIPTYLSPIAAGMTQGLCPYGIRIRWDLDSIPALAYSRVVKSKELENVGFLSIQEKRELAGYPPEFQDGQTPDLPANERPGVAKPTSTPAA